jgi:NADH-quinone oxidoreductase subunit N
MGFEIPNFAPAIPEIFVLIMACIILIVDLFVNKRARIVTYLLVQLTLIIAAVLTWRQFGNAPVLTFDGMYILDNIAVVLKLFIYFTAFMSLVFSRHYVHEQGMPYGEYYVLALLSVLGMMVIVSAHNFITLFLGLELFSLPVYAMVALRRDSPICTEAAIKYFVIGALSSGMLLYGFSMLYGATKSLDISAIANAINQTPAEQQLILIFGLVFVVVGLGFKLGAVPFHMWVPDVYEGAPTSVILFLGSASKLAALGLAFRLLADAMPDLHTHWQQLFIVTAILSMALGNFAAIAQTNIRRMLAYSSIAHMGYMSLGLLTGTAEGYGAALFYMFTYAIMTIGAFGVIILMGRSGVSADEINDLRGLNSRNPWLALMMLLIMFSLAGIPPIVGFMAKVAVLEALITVHFVWLAAIALVFSIVGAYYYIRVVKVMYFEEPQDITPVRYSWDMQVAISFSGLLILLLGIFPGFLSHICQMVFQ